MKLRIINIFLQILFINNIILRQITLRRCCRVSQNVTTKQRYYLNNSYSNVFFIFLKNTNTSVIKIYVWLHWLKNNFVWFTRLPSHLIGTEHITIVLCRINTSISFHHYILLYYYLLMSTLYLWKIYEIQNVKWTTS